MFYRHLGLPYLRNKLFVFFLNFVARLAHLPTGLYIMLALISFFSFLMIAWRTIISGSTGPIFALFLPSENVLSADDRHGRLFPHFKGRCHGNQFCGKWQTPIICRFGIPKLNGISLPKCAH